MCRMGKKSFYIGKIFSIVVILWVFVYTSCENQAFLPPYQAEEDVSMRTSISSGEVLLSSQSVNLTLDYDQSSETPPDYLEIEIFDRDGNSLGIQTIEGDALFEPLPSVTPAEGVEGFFVLKTRLYDKDEVLLQEKEIPFFKVSQLPRISQIEVYPPDSLHPESTGLLIPSVTGSDGLWLRWKMGSKLLDKGPLTDFLNGYKWTAPDAEGVYSITLEVFPEAPPEDDGDFSFESSISSEVQFYVQKRSGSRTGELSPSTHYHTLLHFDGSFQNTGVYEADFVPIGDPVLSVNDGLFGYYFTSADGLKSANGEFSFIAPAESKPFTLTFQGIPSSSMQEDAHMFSVQGSNGDDILQVLTDSIGTPYLYNPKTGQVLHNPTSFNFDNLRELSISVVPVYENSLIVKWYRNGRLVSSSTIPKDSFPEESWYGIQLGGEKLEQGKTGFEGLFNEFGIYFQDENENPSADNGIFGRWILRELGTRDVLMVEGYEHMPEDALVVGTSLMDSENSSAQNREDSSSVADGGSEENSAAGPQEPVGDEDTGESAQTVTRVSSLQTNWDKVGMILYFEDSAELSQGAIHIGPKASTGGEKTENTSNIVEGAGVKIGFDGSLVLPKEMSKETTEAKDVQDSDEEETEVEFSFEDLFSNNVAKLSITRKNGEVVISTAGGKELFRTDSWKGTQLEAEITKKTLNGGSESTNGSVGEPLLINELLLLRDLLTFKDYQ